MLSDHDLGADFLRGWLAMLGLVLDQKPQVRLLDATADVGHRLASYVHYNECAARARHHSVLGLCSAERNIVLSESHYSNAADDAVSGNGQSQNLYATGATRRD